MDGVYAGSCLLVLSTEEITFRGFSVTRHAREKIERKLTFHRCYKTLNDTLNR